MGGKGAGAGEGDWQWVLVQMLGRSRANRCDRKAKRFQKERGFKKGRMGPRGRGRVKKQETRGEGVQRTGGGIEDRVGVGKTIGTVVNARGVGNAERARREERGL